MRIATCLFLAVLMGGLFAPSNAADVTVPFDLIPGACPNPFVTDARGTEVPAAIPGSDEVDPQAINVSSLVLIVPGGGGRGDVYLYPVLFDFRDVATPLIDPDSCACTAEGADGRTDLWMLFDEGELRRALLPFPPGLEVPLIIDGQFNDGTTLAGVDCLLLIAPTATSPGSWGTTKARYR